MVLTLLSRRVVVVTAGAVAALLVAALVVFKPWLLFVSTTVNDQLPVTAQSAPAGDRPAATASSGPSSAAPSPEPGPALLRSGTFISHEHETTGQASIYRLADGSLQLVLADLRTSNGPDVRVWLSTAPVIEGKAGWHVAGQHDRVDLAPLKGNRGNQVYPLPAGTDPSRWTSVVLWCDDFDVSFGAAAFS